MELLNALSMLPCVATALLHRDRDPDCFAKRLGAYSLILTSVASINFHLYKWAHPRFCFNDAQHRVALMLDLLCQNLCAAACSLATVAGVPGALAALACGALDVHRCLYSSVAPKDMVGRHVRYALLVGWMVSDNPPCMALFALAFAAFLGARRRRALHAAFHGLLALAMHALWARDHRHPAARPALPAHWAEPAALSAVLLTLHAASHSWRDPRAFQLLLQAATAACFTGLGLLSFARHFDPARMFARLEAPLPAAQARAELAFYGAFLAVEALQRNPTMVAHHLVAGGLVAASHALGYHMLMLTALALFTLSNAPLALAKWARHVGRPRLARASFLAFAALFVVFRIGAFAALVLFTTVQGLRERPLGHVLLFNLPFAALYAMHLGWLRRVCRILRQTQSCE